jgi:hypothetical protein
MVSTPNYRKNKRFELKSTVMLADEHSEYLTYAQRFNFSGVVCILSHILLTNRAPKFRFNLRTHLFNQALKLYINQLFYRKKFRRRKDCR